MPRVLRARSRVATASALAAVALAAISVYFVATAVPYDAAEVTPVALSAIANQYSAAQSDNPTALSDIFVGDAWNVVSPMRDGVQRDITQGLDYPGTLELTNVKVLHMQGDSSNVTMDVSVHEKLSNMRQGMVVDYSESDVIYHLTLNRINGKWVVSEFAWSFAPGSRP